MGLQSLPHILYTLEIPEETRRKVTIAEEHAMIDGNGEALGDNKGKHLVLLRGPTMTE